MRHLRTHDSAVPSATWADVAALRWTLWIVLASAWFWPALSKPTMLGTAGDWAYFTAHDTSVWLSLAVHHELPGWDPFACGGIPLLGNLQVRPIGITALCSLLFGLLPGLRVALWLMVLLGLEGAYRWARHRGVAGVGALAAAVIFATSGRLVQAIAEGQPGLLAFELAPWALLGLERGWRDWRAATAGGLWMALSFLEGGAVPTPLTAVLLFIVALSRTGLALGRWRPGGASRDDVAIWRPLATLAWMGLVAALATAWRLLPVAESLVRWPRDWQADDVYTIGHVLNMMAVNSVPGTHMANGSSFVGAPVFLVAAVALLLRDRRAGWPLVLTLLTLDLATGTRDLLGLFPAIHHLPVLHNLRHPMRFSLFTALPLGVLAGLTIEHLERWVAAGFARRASSSQTPAWAGRAIAITAAVALAAWPTGKLLHFGHSRLLGTFVRPAPLSAFQPFRQSLGNRWAADVWPAMHLGTLSCFEEQPFPQAEGLRADRPAEEWIELPADGTATRVAWSPNAIDIDVEVVADAGTTLVINQNHHRGWSAGPFQVVERHDGLLAVRLPKGRHRVELRWSDPLSRAGFAITALAASALLIARRRSRHGRAAPAAASPM